MSSSHTFWALVRHEFTLKGSWRKQGRSRVTKSWWTIYLALFAIFGVGIVTYFANHHHLELYHLWVVTTGFPYVLIVTGVSMMKREWENETYGWWLTLPYPRVWLVSSKWIALFLRVVVGASLLFALISLYTVFIILVLPQYAWTDVEASVLTGLNLLILVIGFSPFLTSISMLMGSAAYTSLRPLIPLLWLVFMSGIGFFYSGINTSLLNNLFIKTGAAEDPVISSPFTWEVLVSMVISWVAAFLVIRLCAYLLDRKISL
ncbi:ABC-2 transporter permease [Brevibacillus ginsengisoli]|uniref:ABC-2 transporter permease n=1 Tax=Brevibacillus ginsengisoli TaxID=363854 RepID=UPI003CF8D68B